MEKHYPYMMGIAALAGIFLYSSSIISDEKQRKRERDAFDDLNASDMTPRQIWNKALKYGIEERLNMRGELDRADMMLGKAEEICHVGDGLEKASILAADESVSDKVKIPILNHWLERFCAVLGLDHNVIDCIFSDEKVKQRISMLEEATAGMKPCASCRDREHEPGAASP